VELILFAVAIIVLDFLAHFFGYDSRGVTDSRELTHGLQKLW